MANFKTHIEVATVLSGLASSVLLDLGIVSWQEAVYCWLAGSLGGLLPDIDSDNSHSLSIVFGLLSFLLCIFIILLGIGKVTLIQLWGIALTGHLVLNVIVRSVFEKLTVHRGIFHSVLAGLVSSCLCINIAHLLQLNTNLSWLLGLFIGLGFGIHLLLDEIFSVDLLGARIKRSFGSACKLFDTSNLKLSLLFFGVFLANVFYLPPYAPLLAEIRLSLAH